ncbi:MAG: ABC transporter ATP-binding protein [Cyclobacteriaceae bacterium]|jgi:lipopolysaccharide transport system ATP-binding protein
MSNVVIHIDSVSKQYRLGKIGTGTLSHDLNRWWYQVRGKEDPYLKIGKANDRSQRASSEYVWALQNVSFEVQHGEVLGIIGRNGAGKSTLLKILSRTTLPTRGAVKAKGRIASLLEVGTGFHPELTGKENIFLNGAILGMRKAEIRKQFDAIVDFSGVEAYIDTPVKRYSSGMYVRLAFAVAAHLDPDILIVDEVLAVGDAEFQKKCLGKMKDVSTGDGKTVLFVSHNMTAINSLCTRALYLHNGQVASTGNPEEVITEYLSTGSEIATYRKWTANWPGDDAARLLEVKLTDSDGQPLDVVDFYRAAAIEFQYEVLRPGFCPVPNLHLYNDKGDLVFISGADQEERFGEPGRFRTVMNLPPQLLNTGRYLAGVAVSTTVPEKVHFFERDVIVFDVIEDMNQRTHGYRGTIPGVVRPRLHWSTERKVPL